MNTITLTPEQVLEIPEWVRSILSNDEYSSDEELMDTIWGQCRPQYVTIDEAKKWVESRHFFLNNIVMTDGTVYKPNK